jgi:putative SOS response-associated peptidase YedK
MCGRFSNQATMNEIRLRWEIDLVDVFREWTPKFNIAPSHGPGYEQPIVVLVDGARTLKLGRWWLIPPAWPKPLKELPTAFNARAEELAVKPFWRKAFRSTRCLVPATGWREFVGPKGQKQPWHFQPEGGLFAFAGLWSTWRSPDGLAVDSFAIVTTVPGEAAAKVHNRMPLVLGAEHQAAWLDAGADPEPVLKAAQEEALSLQFELFATNPVGNSVKVEDARVVERAEAPAATS